MSDLEQAWRHELAVRRVCDALSDLTDHIELIEDESLLDSLTEYLKAIKGYVVVAHEISLDR